MATIKLITTEVGKNGAAIVMGDGAVGAPGAIALGANAGKRQPSDPAAEPEVLGEGSIDIRTAENGIYIGGRGAHAELGDDDTDYVVFKIGGEETKLTAAQFRALFGIAGKVTDIVNGAAAGSTAYQKPAGGITAGDLAEAVRTSLGKADTALQSHQPLDSYVTGAEYDSDEKKIYLLHGSTRLAKPVDAAAFIKDGMVSSVNIVEGNLVISFNTDAGQSPISIPLTGIFNPANFYSRTEADDAFVAKESGKGLSTNDYTTADKDKLAGIAAGAQVNPTPIDPDAAGVSGAFADALAVKNALAGKEPKTVQDGTAAHPYLIATRADLEQLQADVAGGECFEGKNFLQTADIDMGSGTWTGIGLKTGDGPDRDHTFKGIYDGGGHAINNLKFAYDDTADVNETMGFFRSCVGATIKNLTVNVLGFDAPAVTSQKFGGAAFVGTMADGITMVNCTANGSLGSEAIPCKHTTAGIIANVDFPSDPATGHQVIDLSFVTNNADVYTIRKGAGIIGFLLHDVTLRHVTNTGLIKRCGADNGREEGVAGIIAWENMGSGDGYLAKYILDGVANLGAVETNQPESGYRRYSSQLVGSWGLSNAGGAESVNLGDVKITLNDKSLPLGGNVQATQSGGVWVSPLDGMGLWFGEVKADGCCHAVKTLENGGEYVFLFKNKTHAGAAYTPPPYTLPAGYTVTIDQRFGAPNIVDSNGDADGITVNQIEGTTKYTYTAPAQS